MIRRAIEEHIRRAAGQFPAVLIQGPRQSGKTTLAKAVFADKRYFNFEAPDVSDLFLKDPRGFLSSIGERGAIFDEIQNVPQLLSYLQGMIDDDRRSNGKYILTGSNNFTIADKVSQSLAGRVAVAKLLPLSVSEIRAGSGNHLEVDELICKGGYPELYATGGAIDLNLFFQSYSDTYVEKDIRRTLNVKDWRMFNRFLQILASRIGYMLDYASISADCGINVKTVKEWLSILEQSYVVFLLPAWYRSRTKRLVKSPKLYFFDTGLACWLLRIASEEKLHVDRMVGNLFENLVVLEKLKEKYNSLLPADLYFYRTSNGVEVDLVEEQGMRLNAFEIKYSSTFASDFTKGLIAFGNDYPDEIDKRIVIYNGEQIKSFQGCLVEKFGYVRIND